MREKGLPRVEIVVEDPWDLVTELGSGPFPGDVVRVPESDFDGLEVRLSSPMIHEKFAWTYLLAKPRHAGSTFRRMDSGIAVHANVEGVSENDRNSKTPGRVSDRPTLAFIGTIRQVFP